MPGGDGGGGGLFFAVKKLLHNSSFFRSRGENHLFMELGLQSDREELSQSLLFHSQEESLPRIIGNELGLDTERMSLKSSEDGLKSSDSHFSMLPLVNYVSSADEDSQLGHNQITLASYVSSHSLCLSRNGSISSGAGRGTHHCSASSVNWVRRKTSTICDEPKKLSCNRFIRGVSIRKIS